MFLMWHHPFLFEGVKIKRMSDVLEYNTIIISVVSAILKDKLLHYSIMY